MRRRLRRHIKACKGQEEGTQVMSRPARCSLALGTLSKFMCHCLPQNDQSASSLPASFSSFSHSGTFQLGSLARNDHPTRELSSRLGALVSPQRSGPHPTTFLARLFHLREVSPSFPRFLFVYTLYMRTNIAVSFTSHERAHSRALR